MCLANIEGLDIERDSPFVVTMMRSDADALKAREMPAVAARLEIGAAVIDALLVERKKLLKRAELAEGQARINAETIRSQARAYAAGEVIDDQVAAAIDYDLNGFERREMRHEGRDRGRSLVE